MGGSVGLKGTDGVAAEAARLGAVRHSGERAASALRELLPLKEELTVLCAGGEMGESLVKGLGFPNVERVYETGAETTADDTRRAAQAMKDADLLLFDPEKIRENGTYAAPDACASGFDEVFVLGGRVIQNGEYRGGSSGEMLGLRAAY